MNRLGPYIVVGPSLNWLVIIMLWTGHIYSVYSNILYSVFISTAQYVIVTSSGAAPG